MPTEGVAMKALHLADPDPLSDTQTQAPRCSAGSLGFFASIALGSR